MKLLTPFAAIIAAAAAGQVYTSQPAEAYANSAEIYQTALEFQQQGLYSDQSHAHSGQGAGDQSVYSGQNAHAESQAYSGHSRPAGEKTAKILSLVSERDGHGYHYAYETDNGIKAQEVGQSTGHQKGTEAHGTYSYTGDDGHEYTVTYTADEHGFRAQGAHFPTPPPIPDAIAKSLEQNAQDEAAGIHDDGKYVEQSHHQEQQIQHHEQVVSDIQHPQVQAFQYESTAFHHDELPSEHQLGGQQSGHLTTGFQPSSHQGFQPSGHQIYQQRGHQGYQPSGFHMVNVPLEGYRKH